MISPVLVFIFGGLGALTRYVVGLGLTRVLESVDMSTNIPWPTFVINLVGSGLIGLLFGWLHLRGQGDAENTLRLMLATGFLGGFTTFSAFSLETGLMILRGQVFEAATYIALSVIGCIAIFILAMMPFITRGAVF